MKTKVEQCRRIGIASIVKGFNNPQARYLIWNDGFNLCFSFGESRTDKSLYVKFMYNMNNQLQSDKAFEYHHWVKLERTKCNLAGYRYWFICPVVIKEKKCNKRVSVLYKPPDKKNFGCRRCHSLIYRSQCLSGLNKKYGEIISFPAIEEEEKTLKRKFYAGFPTEKYSNFLYKEAKNYRRIENRRKAIQLLSNR